MPKSAADLESSFRPERIVSGGQTGVDRAGLEAALALGIAHGGWCPAGRVAEDGMIPSRYALQEMEQADYPARTRQNVVDSDATLIVYEGKLKGGTRLTQAFARQENKPCLLLPIDRAWQAETVHRWFDRHRPQVLNIAGPRESTIPGIFDRAFTALLRMLEKPRSEHGGPQTKTARATKR